MNVKKKMIENKIISVIDSCENMNQLNTAFNWIKNVYPAPNIPTKIYSHYTKKQIQIKDLIRYYLKLKIIRRRSENE